MRELETPFDVLTDDPKGIVRAWHLPNHGKVVWIEVRTENGSVYLKPKTK